MPYGANAKLTGARRDFESAVSVLRTEKGADGVASSHCEVGRELIGWEPADFVGFIRLTIFGRASDDSGQVGRSDPVLAFVRQAVVGDTEKSFDGDLDADFFEGFAYGAGFERLEVVEFAADDAPVIGFGRAFASVEGCGLGDRLRGRLRRLWGGVGW